MPQWRKIKEIFLMVEWIVVSSFHLSSTIKVALFHSHWETRPCFDFLCSPAPDSKAVNSLTTPYIPILKVGLLHNFHFFEVILSDIFVICSKRNTPNSYVWQWYCWLYFSILENFKRFLRILRSHKPRKYIFSIIVYKVRGNLSDGYDTFNQRKLGLALSNL